MKNLVYLDCESTSAEDDCRLVQLAIRLAEPRPPNPHSLSVMFKPPVPITFEAMAIHHITEKHVASAGPLDDTWRSRIRLMTDGAIIVAHNAPFDIGVLKREGVEIPEWIDTLKVARRLWPDWPQHKLQYLRYRLGIEIEAGEAHDAMNDVIMLEAVFQEMLKTAKTVLGMKAHLCSKGDPKDVAEAAAMVEREMIIDTMVKWSREPSLLHTFAFGKYKGMTYQAVATADRGYLEWILTKGADFDEDVRHTAGHWLNETMPKRKPSPQTKLDV